MSKISNNTAESESDPLTLENLSQQAMATLRVYGGKPKAVIKPKGKKHYIAEPRIQEHVRKGRRPFYTYRRGADSEIYLGDAEAILRKVKGI